jgi:pimeloyl-ACP methyl ester carboxylesterase
MKNLNASLVLFVLTVAVSRWLGAGNSFAQETSASVTTESKWVRIEGNDVGVPWMEMVKQLRPTLDLSRVTFAANDLVIPWTDLRQASESSPSYREAMRIIGDTSGKPTAIEIDTVALSKNASMWKQEFAEWRAAEGGKAAFRIEDTPITQAGSATKKHHILVIAGYQSQPGESETVAQYLHEKTSLPCEFFSYPSDGGMSVSAKKLAELLEARLQQSPGTEWTIVAHSMGSIIARAAIELHEAKGIQQLIQICPPNHGCVLAEIAEPLDGIMIAKSQLTRIFSSFDGGGHDSLGKAVAPAAVLNWMSEGFGLASRDLCPDSEFLKLLNSRPRSSSVSYSILIGTGGPLRPLVGTAILLSGPALDQQLANQKDLEDVRKAWAWVERLVRDGQLIQGRGDGVVAVHSAQLNGVSDVATIPCSHIAWSFVKNENGQRVMEEVLKRIKP